LTFDFAEIPVGFIHTTTQAVTSTLRICRFTGYDSPPKLADSNITKTNHHVHGAKNETWMDEQIAGYKKILGLKACTKYTCIPPMDYSK
jgi:hypothetical protein